MEDAGAVESCVCVEDDMVRVRRLHELRMLCESVCVGDKLKEIYKGLPGVV